MTKIALLGAALALVAGGWSANAAADSGDKPDGKAVFLEKKCNLCHSVSGAGVSAPKDSKMKIVDLSGLAAKGRTATWLKAYLEKTEKLEDKAHPPKFRGTPAELDALVEWLLSVKPAG